MKRKSIGSTRLALVVVVALDVFLASVVQARAEDRQVQQFDRTYALSPNGQLSLENVNGSVHITGWDQSQVKIHAIETVWQGTSLRDVKTEVDSRPDSIHIETQYPHHWFGDSHWRVDYTVMMPLHASIDKVGVVNGAVDIENIYGHVSVSSVNGHIQTRAISGGVDLSAVNGTIGTVLTNPDLSQPVSIKTVNGSISLSLPSDMNAHISASTLNGGISCEFPIRINAGYVGRSLDGTLGKGGSDVHLRTVNGSISIHRASSDVN
jgi:Putative adhesin